jgi:hypothetical protein
MGFANNAVSWDIYIRNKLRTLRILERPTRLGTGL